MAEKLTAQKLREYLHYDAKTGLCFWKKSPGYRYKPGQRAGSKVRHNGYYDICICGERRSVAKWAWLWMTGAHAVGDVDHRNTIRTDDRWRNLRPATRSQNNANRVLCSNNTSGLYRGQRSPDPSWLFRR